MSKWKTDYGENISGADVVTRGEGERERPLRLRHVWRRTLTIGEDTEHKRREKSKKGQMTQNILLGVGADEKKKKKLQPFTKNRNTIGSKALKKKKKACPSISIPCFFPLATTKMHRPRPASNARRADHIKK